MRFCLALSFCLSCKYLNACRFIKLIVNEREKKWMTPPEGLSSTWHIFLCIFLFLPWQRMRSHVEKVTQAIRMSQLSFKNQKNPTHCSDNVVVQRVRIPARRASPLSPSLLSHWSDSLAQLLSFSLSRHLPTFCVSLSVCLSQDGFCLRHAAVYRRVLTGGFQIPQAALIFKKRWPCPGLSRLGILNWQGC